MLIARWQIDARFGHKQTVIDLMQRWLRDVGSKAGTDTMDVKLLTGSVGAREATLEVNHTVESLAKLEQLLRGHRQARRAQAVGQGSGALRRLRVLTLGYLSRNLKHSSSAARRSSSALLAREQRRTSASRKSRRRTTSACALGMRGAPRLRKKWTVACGKIGGGPAVLPPSPRLTYQPAYKPGSVRPAAYVANVMPLHVIAQQTKP